MPSLLQVAQERKASLTRALTAALAPAQAAPGRSLTEDERATSERIVAEVAANDRDLALALAEENAKREVISRAAAEQVPAEAKGDVRPFRSFRDQIVAVVAAGRGQIDPRLMILAAASGGNTSVPSDGGFVVQSEWSNMLWAKAKEEGLLFPRCSNLELPANCDTMKAPYVDETSRATGSRWGGVRVYRRKEAATVTASNPTFARFELTLEDLMGISYMTGRETTDAAMAAEIVKTAFPSEMAFRLDDECVRGDGAGEMTGILNATCTVSVAKESGQVAATIVFENLLKMWQHVSPKSKARGEWYVNSECLAQLNALVQVVGIAGMPPRFVDYGPTGLLRIFGRPVNECEQCSALGTVGDIFFADWTEYQTVTKGPMQADESMHVRFLYDEMCLRWIYRANGKPRARTAITPYNGTATHSAFVTLATRA